MLDVNLSQPAFTLSIGQLIDIMKGQELPKPQQPIIVENKPKYLYSIRSLAKELGCSVMTAQKLKNSGVIPYSQFGRKCIFEVEEVIKSLEKTRKTRKAV